MCKIAGCIGLVWDGNIMMKLSALVRTIECDIGMMDFHRDLPPLLLFIS